MTKDWKSRLDEILSSEKEQETKQGLDREEISKFIENNIIKAYEEISLKLKEYGLIGLPVSNADNVIQSADLIVREDTLYHFAFRTIVTTDDHNFNLDFQYGINTERLERGDLSTKISKSEPNIDAVYDAFTQAYQNTFIS